MQFAGDFSGATWNIQALFARKVLRHGPKVRHTLHLARRHDFLGLQEAHSAEGRVTALSLPPGSRAFWSHGSRRQAGVGLPVTESFLSNFNPVEAAEWVEVEAGRSAVLRLRGPKGGLDLVVVYLASGEGASQERTASLRRLSAALSAKQHVLTVMMGDFNYAASAKDRFNKEIGEWSGARDSTDEEAFQASIVQPLFFLNGNRASSRAR